MKGYLRATGIVILFIIGFFTAAFIVNFMFDLISEYPFIFPIIIFVLTVHAVKITR